ncbi:MAG: hypothetical protein GF398_13620 [Chitinivibrionales bacterium]|nr:hypothetical protein [Chitinivibrionales bacterium]
MKQLTCPDCEGSGKTEKFNIDPRTGEYTSEDIACGVCKGTGKIKVRTLKDINYFFKGKYTN